eukprot:9441724-Heterocapsa_arctica.AAC.1
MREALAQILAELAGSTPPDVTQHAKAVNYTVSQSTFYGAPSSSSGNGLGRGGEQPTRVQPQTLAAGSGETVGARKGRPPLSDEEKADRVKAKAKSTY